MPIHTFIDQWTREETSSQVQPAFPYRADICEMSMEPGYLCPWHWHNEVEIFYMADGALEYHLPDGTHFFGPGDVGFINASVLHMTRGIGKRRCRQQEHIFLPRLVAGGAGGAIERRYVLPLLQNRNASLIRVDASRPEAETMRRLMDRSFRGFVEKPRGHELLIRGWMSELWLQLLPFAPPAGNAVSSADYERLKAMLRCIEERYEEKLLLEDIASSAIIGSREAARCFRRQIGMSPIEYLLSYRIDRAGELLRNGELPVTEVGLRCGFSSASYFGKMFREKVGQSPSAYRQSAREENHA